METEWLKDLSLWVVSYAQGLNSFGTISHVIITSEPGQRKHYDGCLSAFISDELNALFTVQSILAKKKKLSAIALHYCPGNRYQAA
jgi:hypothetical protein